MKVVVLSRLIAEGVAAIMPVPYAIISISEPPTKGGVEYIKPMFKENSNQIGILRMQFYDLDNSSTKSTSTEETQQLPKKYKDGLFTEEHAEQILGFVVTMKDKVEVMICHCEAGISRSAGVAAAILRILTGSDDQIFRDPKYIPNTFIYRTILNTWEYWQDK